jgi:hypothetical protein
MKSVLLLDRPQYLFKGHRRLKCKLIIMDYPEVFMQFSVLIMPYPDIIIVNPKLITLYRDFIMERQ